jgi:hypothetical protein
VRLHAICREPPDVKITEDEMGAWFDSWYDEARLVGEQRGINLLATVFHDAARTDVVLYDRLVEIRCPLHKTGI